MSQQRPAQPRTRTATLFRLWRHLGVAVLASCLVAAVTAFASSAAAYITACPKIPRATITAATGLPHTAVVQSDSRDCSLLLWRGHKPSPGKQSKAAEKAGTLAVLTVKSEDFHEPYSEAHDTGFSDRLIVQKLYVENHYTPFTVSTLGAESALAGLGINRPSPFQVIGLWWSYSESAYVQIYLGQYHKSGLQLEHELTAIAARTVPVFGL